MYNDLIDDFSTPRQKNAFGIEPSQSNIIQPGKSPMSSINPMSRRRMFSYIEFPRSQGHAHNIRSGALVTRMATYRRARTFRHALTECLSKREKVQYLQTWTTGCWDGAVVRALASHQCCPGSIPGLGVICGLSLLVLYSAPRGFLRVLRFPLSSKTNI